MVKSQAELNGLPIYVAIRKYYPEDLACIDEPTVVWKSESAEVLTLNGPPAFFVGFQPRTRDEGPALRVAELRWTADEKSRMQFRLSNVYLCVVVDKTLEQCEKQDSLTVEFGKAALKSIEFYSRPNRDFCPGYGLSSPELGDPVTYHRPDPRLCLQYEQLLETKAGRGQ